MEDLEACTEEVLNSESGAETMSALVQRRVMIRTSRKNNLTVKQGQERLEQAVDSIIKIRPFQWFRKQV